MLQITEHVQDNNVSLMLSGRLDIQARTLFQTALKQAQSTNPKEIILDFRAVQFIDSSGLALLILAKKTVLDPHCQMSLVVSSGYVRKILDLTNMGERFSITLLEPTNHTPPPTSQ